MVKSYEKQAKSKADIAKEKSLVTKQRIKEKEKAATTKEKKDLDATHRRVTGGGIHAGKPKKGIDVEIKEKPTVKIKPKTKKDIAQKKSKEALEKEKEGVRVSTPEKHPAHDPDKGGGIHRGKPPKGKYKKPPKGAQAAEVDRGGKSPGPKERKKLPKISGKAREDAKRAKIREDARKPKKKEAKKQAETGTRETSYEARVKALVAKKANLSKKETADGRSEYQVQMNKLKKENKKAWKKMFKGGKLKS
jgi:hypothetical protein